MRPKNSSWGYGDRARSRQQAAEQTEGTFYEMTIKNKKSTPIPAIIDQMNESRPLPMGRKEFEEWSERIIAGAMVPAENPDALKESQRHALCGMLLHVGPTESHKPDAFFIHSLRKSAVNVVAYTMSEEIKSRKNKAMEDGKEAECPTPTP